MLKIAAFEDHHEDRPVLLKLVTDTNEVDLDVVDSHGDQHPRGKLLAIRESGLYLYPSVCPKIGLPLDSEGRLKVFNPKPPAELMELLRPLAEYIAARDRQGYDESNDFTPLSAFEGLRLTMGQMRALAAYYEANK